MSYTKLFSHIVTSTIWREPKEVKILWITMLALSNKHGEVMASIPGLSDMARLTLEETEGALEVLEGPDVYSRTPDYEGRRIEKIEGGWHILNYAKHRRMASLDERREMNAARQRRFREKQKEKDDEPVTLSVTQNNESNDRVTQLDDKAEAEAEYKDSTQYSESTKVPLSVGENGNKSRPPKRIATKVDASNDEIFLEQLRTHYPNINLEGEFRKMRAWQLTPNGKGKILNKRRIVNWLNRCDPAFDIPTAQKGKSQWTQEQKQLLGL